MSEEAASKSRELFESGLYCAESVLISLAEGQGIKSDLVPRIATGFCSGVSRTCGTCGAVSGAILGLGLAVGRDSPDESVEECYALVNELVDGFQAKFWSINCAQLTGCDLATDEGQRAFEEQGQIERCFQYVEEAARMAMRMIARDASSR